MKLKRAAQLLGGMLLVLTPLKAPAAAPEAPFTLAIHGGAGIARADLTPEKEAACREVLATALRSGHAVLKDGGSSVEAVQAAIVILEDSPLFNAGRGAVLTSEGTVELDASLMDGSKPAAGAVAGVKGVRNPILLAHEVMLHTPHVMLHGEGAAAFAKARGLKLEPQEYFITPEQQARLKKAKEKAAKKSAGLESRDDDLTLRMGTVGAVALDKQGRLAAGTSTGGLTNKMPGRLGDSPVIGAGTYAENGVCAVSCTGHGEYFIRSVVAYDVAARMKYQGLGVKEAAAAIIRDQLPKLGGSGGLIALDSKGRVTAPFNTPGMFHGWISADGVVHVGIFAEGE